MDWIEVDKQLPPFNKTVVLVKEGVEPKMGFLKSIDSEGNHFVESEYQNSFNLFDRSMKERFKPTHWCEIELPSFKKTE